MVAVGVGGADAVDVLTGQPWELEDASPHRCASYRQTLWLGYS